MSGGRPNESLYYQRGDSLYYPRTRRPPPSHPAPNNAGVVLVVMMVLAIVVAVVFVGPGLVGEVRHMVYCMDHAQEAACS